MNKNNRYYLELCEGIKERTGMDCPKWMIPAVRTTAMQMQILDRLQSELNHDDFTSIEVGSNNQTKTIVNPLLSTYRDAQRTLNLQLTSLGLTYNSTPKKITEKTKMGEDATDPLQNWMKNI